MADKWAYTAYGRLRKTDVWNWFGPTDRRGFDPLVGGLYGTTNRAFLGNHNILDEGVHVLGFDGKNWLVGFMALPTSVLDANKYSRADYAVDYQGNRPIRFLHGYVSENSNLPDYLPKVDAEQFRAQHESKIIPLWDRSAKGEPIGSLTHERKVTPFEAIGDIVAIEQRLPADAIATLRDAQREARPIAIHFDPATNQWSEMGGFRSEVSRIQKLANDMERPASHATTSIAPTGNAEPVGNPAQGSGVAARSWIRRVWECPGGKLAIIGGTVALGALVGYWAYRARHGNKNDPSPIDNERAR
jgi:hypothetical protein